MVLYLNCFRACEKNDFQMTVSLLNYGFYIELDEDAKKSLKGGGMISSIPLTKRKFKNHNSVDDILIEYRLFRAASRPAHMIAEYRTKCQDTKLDDDRGDDKDDVTDEDIMKDLDPIAKSFDNMHFAILCKANHVEYAHKFNEIIQENQSFSVRLLDLCRGQEQCLSILTSIRIY